MRHPAMASPGRLDRQSLPNIEVGRHSGNAGVKAASIGSSVIYLCAGIDVAGHFGFDLYNDGTLVRALGHRPSFAVRRLPFLPSNIVHRLASG